MMGFMPDGSVHRRDKNLILSPKGLSISTATFSASSTVVSPFFVNSFDVPIPGGALPGDFAIIVVLSRFTDGVTTPAGWALFDFITVGSNGAARFYTRQLQPGDTNVNFVINNVGVSYCANFFSFTGATEVAVISKLQDQAVAATTSFNNVAAPQQQMNAVLVALRSGLQTVPWFAITASGNLAPITLSSPQASSSPPAYAGAVGRGRMIPGVSTTGVVTGSMGTNSDASSTAVMLIR